MHIYADDRFWNTKQRDRYTHYKILFIKHKINEADRHYCTYKYTSVHTDEQIRQTTPLACKLAAWKDLFLPKTHTRFKICFRALLFHLPGLCGSFSLITGGHG